MDAVGHGEWLRKEVWIPEALLNLIQQTAQGVNDPLSDLEGVRNFYQHMQPLYANPEEVRLIEYPGVGHFTPYGMQIDAMHWFQRFL